MLYTSGTTGRPKGVPITGAALGANTTALVEAWGFSEHDTLVHSLPTNHAHGLFVALGCALASGATLRWVDRFDAAIVADLLPGASAFMGVPTHYVRLLDEPGFDRGASTSIRLFTSGSAPLPTVTFDRIAERTGIEVVERYGMTETLMLTSTPLDGPRRPGSVGKALPGVEVRLGPADPASQTRPVVGMVEVRRACSTGTGGVRRTERPPRPPTPANTWFHPAIWGAGTTTITSSSLAARRS
jgi:malonyl-CoA/methylmalonyl-CoA synthetase